MKEIRANRRVTLTTSTPYPAYKPSGVPWLGNVPQHWTIRKVSHLFSVGSGTTPPTDQQQYYGGDVPWVTTSELREGVLTSTEKSVTIEALQRFPTLKTYPVGSVVVAMYGATIGRLGTLGTVAAVNQACCVFAGEKDMHLNFLAYWLQSMRSQLMAMGYGGGQPNLSQVLLKSLRVPLPPLPEQRAIVRYLDHVDERIQRYVDAKEKLVGVLEEEKQAVVNRAVTRGLDPNVRLKPSGVDWLGDVLVHWEVQPVKRAFQSMDYGISASATDSGSIRLLTMGHLQDGQVIVPSDGGVDCVAPALLLQDGDLLFNRTNSQELVGKVGLFTGNHTPVTFASYLVRLRPQPWNVPEYLNLALNDASFILRARREAIPSLHQSNLNPTRFGRLQIALPPLSEQRSIVAYLDKTTANIDAAITRARRQIELLQEYRTRLIADVVTGKLDVREAAAQLREHTMTGSG